MTGWMIIRMPQIIIPIVFKDAHARLDLRKSQQKYINNRRFSKYTVLR
jgi:hypothetical protein